MVQVKNDRMLAPKLFWESTDPETVHWFPLCDEVSSLKCALDGDFNRFRTKSLHWYSASKESTLELLELLDDDVRAVELLEDEVLDDDDEEDRDVELCDEVGVSFWVDEHAATATSRRIHHLTFRR